VDRLVFASLKKPEPLAVKLLINGLLRLASLSHALHDVIASVLFRIFSERIGVATGSHLSVVKFLFSSEILNTISERLPKSWVRLNHLLALKCSPVFCGIGLLFGELFRKIDETKLIFKFSTHVNPQIKGLYQ